MSYLFLCTNITMKECFVKQLFGIIEKHWPAVSQINPRDTLFLYNINTRSLIGPFEATSEGQLRIDADAWIKAGREFPAQVKVTWDTLFKLKKANRLFPFLNDPNTCKIAPASTYQMLTALQNSPQYRIDIIPETRVSIDWTTERQFASFLDRNNIVYIRFSQTRGDFSKTLREMRAKRPDFLVFAAKPYFIEVKPNPIYRRREVTIQAEEIQKLKQLELATRIETLITFPLDIEGIEWRSLSPAWVWAKGELKERRGSSIYTIPIKDIENKKIPFI